MPARCGRLECCPPRPAAVRTQDLGVNCAAAGWSAWSSRSDPEAVSAVMELDWKAEMCLQRRQPCARTFRRRKTVGWHLGTSGLEGALALAHGGAK